MNANLIKLNKEQMNVLAHIIDEAIEKRGCTIKEISGTTGILETYVSAARSPIYIHSRIGKAKLEILLSYLDLSTDVLFTQMDPAHYKTLQEQVTEKIAILMEKQKHRLGKPKKRKKAVKLESKNMDPVAEMRSRPPLIPIPVVPDPKPGAVPVPPGLNKAFKPVFSELKTDIPGPSTTTEKAAEQNLRNDVTKFLEDIPEPGYQLICENVTHREDHIIRLEDDFEADYTVVYTEKDKMTVMYGGIIIARSKEHARALISLLNIFLDKELL